MESKLIAGKEQILEWTREVWSIDDPVICIWQTEENPTELNNSDDKFLGIDVVRFYVKEQIDSLFFPFGFVYGTYNLVLAGIKEDDPNIIHTPMNGLMRGWLYGSNLEELMITIDLDF